MPENTTTASTEAGDDSDDIRARFAHLEQEAAPETVTDELPPVPTVSYKRPLTEAQKREQARSAGGTSRIMGGGLVGNSKDVKGSGIALTIGTNLVASIVVGTGLGWLVDKYLLHSTTTPWGLIVGFLLGTAAGFVSLVRAANQINKD